MDNILIIDGHNAMHRANVIFGGDSKMHELSKDILNQCKCGAIWDSEFDCCPEDFLMIFNFFRNLRPMIEMFKPDKCFFVLEGHPQFRYDIYPEYKANRIIKTANKITARNLFFKRKNEIVSLLQYLPITTARAANYEADDVVNTLCGDLREEKVTILSNDSDFIQLLQKGYQNLQIYNPIKKCFMENPSGVYVANKSIRGDKTDNIKSLLTPKKADKVLSDPKLFDAWLSVEENRANFAINRSLIEFREVPAEEINLKEGIRNFPKLKEEFQRMKFESITNDSSWQKYTSTFNCLKY